MLSDYGGYGGQVNINGCAEHSLIRLCFFMRQNIYWRGESDVVDKDRGI